MPAKRNIKHLWKVHVSDGAKHNGKFGKLLKLLKHKGTEIRFSVPLANVVDASALLIKPVYSHEKDILLLFSYDLRPDFFPYGKRHIKASLVVLFNV